MPKYKYVDGVKYRVVPQSVLGYALVRVDSDNSLPSGGTEGQVLTKASDTDYDVEWTSIPEGVAVIDLTLVLTPPHDIPGDYQLLFTASESLSEIGAMISESPVFLRGNLGSGESETAMFYIPLTEYVDYPGMGTFAVGGLIIRGSTGDELQTVYGFEYDNVTYFGTTKATGGGGALIITGTADLDHNTYTPTTPLQDISDILDVGGYLAVDLNGYIIPLVINSSSPYFELLIVENTTSTYIELGRYNVYGYLDNTPWECYYTKYKVSITS